MLALGIFYCMCVCVGVDVSIQSCLQTLSDLIDCGLPDSSVHGVTQARILAWVVFPSSEDLPDPGIEYRSLAWQADSLPPELPGKSLLQVEFLIQNNGPKSMGRFIGILEPSKILFV